MPQIKAGSTSTGDAYQQSSITHTVKAGAAGDTQVVAVNCQGNINVSSISENGGGAWTSRVNSLNTGGNALWRVFSRKLSADCAQYDATITLSGALPYNGLSLSFGVDGEFDSISSVLTEFSNWGSALQTPAHTSTASDPLAVYMGAVDYNRTFTAPAGAGITIDVQTSSSGGPDLFAASRQITGTAIAAQDGGAPFAIVGGTDLWQSVVIAFKGAAVVGGTLMEATGSLPSVGSVSANGSLGTMSVGDSRILQITVLDQLGDPMPNANVIAAVRAGSGLGANLAAATVTSSGLTNQLGKASITVTAAEAGNAVIGVGVGTTSALSLAVSVQSGPVAGSPTAPSGVSIAAGGADRLTVSWTDNSTNETGFRVRLKGSSGGATVAQADVAANVTSTEFTGLSAATTYWADVAALGSVGNSAYASEASGATTSSAQLYATFLVAASDLNGSAVNGSSGWKAIVWAAPTDGGLAGAELVDVGGLTFESALVGGEARIKIPVSGVTLGVAVRAVLQDGTRTTGIIPGTVTT